MTRGWSFPSVVTTVIWGELRSGPTPCAISFASGGLSLGICESRFMTRSTRRTAHYGRGNVGEMGREIDVIADAEEGSNWLHIEKLLKENALSVNVWTDMRDADGSKLGKSFAGYISGGRINLAHPPI
jgi:hypothetical protein